MKRVLVFNRETDDYQVNPAIKSFDELIELCKGTGDHPHELLRMICCQAGFKIPDDMWKEFNMDDRRTLFATYHNQKVVVKKFEVGKSYFGYANGLAGLDWDAGRYRIVSRTSEYNSFGRSTLQAVLEKDGVDKWVFTFEVKNELGKEVALSKEILPSKTVYMKP